MGCVLLVLFVVRMCHPEVNEKRSAHSEIVAEATAAVPAEDVSGRDGEPEAQATAPTGVSDPTGQTQVPDTLAHFEPAPLFAPSAAMPSFRQADGTPIRNRIYSVPSYANCFPDVQDVQFPAAVANGVSPVLDRAEAELRMSELVYIGASPYYMIDPRMNSSIPYLVPKASLLLQDIGRRFLDSLAIKGIPLHTIIVTSVLRTESDLKRLRRSNGNASEQSCHRFATTFDISYNRYHTVSPPDGPERRPVRNDSLKFVLSEVLRDMRESGRCYIKHEVKQSCFHITVR